MSAPLMIIGIDIYKVQCQSNTINLGTGSRNFNYIMLFIFCHLLSMFVLRCNLCNYRVHIKCNKIDNQSYEYISKMGEPHFCLKCQEEVFPFQKLTKQQFLATTKSDVINNINRYIKEVEEDNSVEINCNYIDIDSFHYKNNKNNLSLFHLNKASLQKHKEELETILNMINLKFEVLGIPEIKIRRHIEPITNINLESIKYILLLQKLKREEY